MKKVFITALLIASIGMYSYAQDFSFGVKAGFSLSTMSHDGNGTNVSHPFQPGFTAGFFGQCDLTDMFGVSMEALYAMQGYVSKSESVDYKNTIMTHMVKVPVLFNVNLLDGKLNLQAGPQFGFILAEKSIGATYDGKNKITNTVDQDYYNMFDLNVAIGANFYLTDNLFAGVRYELGLMDTQKALKLSSASIEDYNSKFRVITLMVGYRF